MNLEELQEALESIFELEDLSPNLNFTISKKNGEIVIHTGLCQDNNGELSNLDDEEAEYEEETDFDDSFGSIIDEEDEEVENEDE
jgi:hypothetical protein